MLDNHSIEILWTGLSLRTLFQLNVKFPFLPYSLCLHEIWDIKIKKSVVFEVFRRKYHELGSILPLVAFYKMKCFES